MSRPAMLNLLENLTSKEWKKLELPSDSKFKLYSSGEDSPIKYKKIMNIVFLQGVITPKSDIEGSAEEQLILKLPEELVPSYPGRFICQGTGKNIWLLNLNKDGKLSFSRYGSSSDAICLEGNWLPFNIVYTL